MRRLAVEKGRRRVFVDVDQIDWIGALGNYARLSCGERSYILRAAMNHLETILDLAHLLRIHRSTIVRLERIQEIRRQSTGSWVVILDDGERLQVSRRRRKGLGSIAAPP